ncbi:MAG: nucleotidyltransferase [Myxococcota bacterium]
MKHGRWSQKNAELVRVLIEAEFSFVIVGGVAAVLHGSSRMTVDLDVAAPFDRDNISRLCRAIAPYEPVHATRPDLRFLDEPIERLLKFRLFLIQTTLGRLDVLRQVQPLGEFEALRSVELEVYGQRALVLNRDDLIQVKRAVARPKDIEVALELEAIREREEG